MAGSNVLGKALGGGGGSARSEAAQRVDQVFDNSNWFVQIGQDNTTTSDRKQSSLPQLDWQVLALIAGGVILWRLMRKKSA
jgi:hypothetical protein